MRRKARCFVPTSPAQERVDEARIAALWQHAFALGAASTRPRPDWLQQPTWRTPLTPGGGPVVSRHADFGAWFVGE